MNRLEQLEKNHTKYMEGIKKYAVSDQPEMRALTDLLLETEANPWGFLPEVWASCTESSSGMYSLLNNIHHSLYDDGDISFPIVNGEPRIAFVWKGEDNYANYVLSETEKRMRDQYDSEYTIEFCTDALDFVARHKEYHRTDIQRCFILDAAMHGITFAVNHYCEYANFDSDWEFDDEIMDKIMKRRAVFGHTPVDYPEPKE
jgi:hypothetical protein